MPSLLDTLQELFNTQDLYEVLETTPEAADAQIKKAYHRVSLKVHPDRASPDERELATKKFQALGATYKVLSDPDSRALYDETGEIDEENDSMLSDPNRDWDDYWRLIFKKVTLKDIQDFEKKYRNSDEELHDLKSAYLEFEGDMEKILDTVLCAVYDDEDRFSEVIRDWINDGEVPEFKKFSKESKAAKEKRKRARIAEAKEAEETAKELGISKNTSLESMIMQRQEQRARQSESFLDQLAAKYSKSEGKTKKKKK